MGGVIGVHSIVGSQEGGRVACRGLRARCGGRRGNNTSPGGRRARGVADVAEDHLVVEGANVLDVAVRAVEVLGPLRAGGRRTPPAQSLLCVKYTLLML